MWYFLISSKNNKSCSMLLNGKKWGWRAKNAVIIHCWTHTHTLCEHSRTLHYIYSHWNIHTKSFARHMHNSKLRWQDEFDAPTSCARAHVTERMRRAARKKILPNILTSNWLWQVCAAKLYTHNVCKCSHIHTYWFTVTATCTRALARTASRWNRTDDLCVHWVQIRVCACLVIRVLAARALGTDDDVLLSV